jgi:hypothetical protein
MFDNGLMMTKIGCDIVESSRVMHRRPDLVMSAFAPCSSWKIKWREGLSRKNSHEAIM